MTGTIEGKTVPVVSIIIVNFNTRDFLKDCINSIKQKTLRISYEIIVIDNASVDGSVEMVRNEFHDVIIIEAGSNLGFGRANNLGVETARGEYLLFLNSDTRLVNDAIFELYSFMSNHSECGIAGGNLTDFSGNPAHSFGMRFPGPFSDIARIFPETRHGPGVTKHEYNVTGKPKKIAYVTGADLMINRSLFLDIGGFDPDFFMYFEETELTHRVHAKGFFVYSVPSAMIMHFKGGSLTRLDGVKSIVYKSKYLYMLKVYGRIGIIVAHTSFKIFCHSKILTHALMGKKNSIVKYHEMLITESLAYRSQG